MAEFKIKSARDAICSDFLADLAKNTKSTIHRFVAFASYINILSPLLCQRDIAVPFFRQSAARRADEKKGEYLLFSFVNSAFLRLLISRHRKFFRTDAKFAQRFTAFPIRRTNSRGNHPDFYEGFPWNRAWNARQQSPNRETSLGRLSKPINEATLVSFVPSNHFPSPSPLPAVY